MLLFVFACFTSIDIAATTCYYKEYDLPKIPRVIGYNTTMSTTANARNAAEHSRRAPATSGSQSRVSTSRLGAKERPLSSAEVIPDDSASNGPHGRSASGAHKINVSTPTLGEKQTGRVHLAARENLQFRTRSPVKGSAGGDVDDRGPKERVSIRQGSRAAEGQIRSPKKEKKASRGLP